MSFKRGKVVMLPTNEKALLSLWGKWLFNGTDSNREPKPINQHLYITSDDKIKKDDDVLFVKYGTIHKAVHDNHFEFIKGDCKKIIATTDSSLTTGKGLDSFSGKPDTLPQPSQSFIEKYVEKYNKGNIITDVLVEYGFTINKSLGHFNQYREYFLKVNPKDNTITIKKVKNSWNKEELYNEIKNNFTCKNQITFLNSFVEYL